MRFSKWLLGIVGVMCFSGSATWAQPPSTVDTLRMVPTNFIVANPAANANFKVAVFIHQATTLAAIAIPIRFPGHPNLRIDTTINSATTPGISQGPAGANASWTLRTSLVDNTTKGILIGYVSFGAVAPINDTLAYVNFDYDASGTSAAITLDTGIVNSQHLGITDTQAQEMIPRWTKGLITIGNPQPAIGLNPTSMIFDGVIGTANPAAKPLSITNTGAGTLNWTAITSQPWLSVNPTSGVGNGTPNVSVNLAGLTAGTLTGWVIVSDPAASNTPESLFVSLNLSKPSLVAAPPSLTFTGVAGGAIPVAQNIQLSASQAAAIAWTGTKSSTWLTINPTGGTTPNSIRDSVNTTGLAAGTYRDTIVVTSANASNSPLRIPVTLLLTSPPMIALNPTTLGFTAQEGGANPKPDTVLLTNSGSGVMDFSASSDQSWLSVTPSAGNAPAFLQVSANILGLLPDTYTGHVIVASSVAVNTPETVTVSLTVTSAPPVLSVAPTTASFSATEGDLVASPTSERVLITNAGSGTLNWNIVGKDSAWVVLSKSSGGAPDSMFVSVNPSGKPVGNYQEVFQISDPAATGSPVSFTVNLEVLPGPPTIALSPSSFTFTGAFGGSNPASQPLSITNIGGAQPLAWTATHTGSWLSLSSSAGTAPSSVNLSVNTLGLAVGDYADTVVVNSGTATNSPQRAVVTLHVTPPPPMIAASPDSLTFEATLGDADPASQSLAISNAGGGVLAWTLGFTGGFVSTSDTSGTAPSTIDVSVSLAGLLAGTHTGSIQISGTGATNSPLSVPVVFIVHDLAPVLSVSPASLTFTAQEGGAAPLPQSFHISNAGGSVLTWNVSSTAPFISLLDPASGTQTGDVAVHVNQGSLSAGTYVDSVLVNAGTAGGSPQYVLITLELAEPPPPVIVLQPTSFEFTASLGGSAPPDQALNITNGGGRTLSWEATQTESWLHLSIAAGTAPSVTMLQVDPSALAVGDYYDTVVVTSALATNTPQSASVHLHVVDNPPVIVLSPNSFHFEMVKGDPNPPCQSLAITNAGAGNLNWSAIKKAGWLTLSSASGTAPSSVDLCILGSTLVAGTYRDTIVVSSGDALNSPQRAIVTLVVKSVAKPSIVLQPDSLHFVLSAGSNAATQCTYVFINGNGGRLVWHARTQAPWIEVGMDSCNISMPLCLTVHTDGLAPGSYCDSVEVYGDASNSPQFLAVCMDVTPQGEQPVLAVTPSHLEVEVVQGSGLQTRDLTITNVGSGSLTWAINTGLLGPWLSVSSAAGSAPGATQAQIDPAGLVPGVYADTIVVASPEASNSPVRVPVVLTVTGSVVLVDSVRVGSDSASPGQVATIPVYFDNSQPLFGVSAPLTWTGTGVRADSVSFAGSRASLSDITAWSVDTLAREIRIGLIPASAAAVPAGSGLLATVYFTVSPLAPNQTVDIDSVTTGPPAISLSFVDTTTTEYTPGFRMGHIVVQGAQAPVLAVVPDSLQFSGTAGGVNPPSQFVVVQNTGGSFLTYQATESIPWLTLAPGTGSQGDTVHFSVNLAGLSENVYTGSVRFVSPEANDTVNVAVVLAVGAAVNPPVLVLSPDVLNFTMVTGVLPSSQSLTVLNSGGGSLSWTATKTQTWFTVSPSTGGAGQVVTVNITNAGLSVGSHSDTITFTDPGASNSPRKAVVNVVVTGPPRPDTVRVASVTAHPGDTVTVAVSIKNTFDVTGITLPFKYSGTGVKLVSSAVTSRSGPAIFPISTNLIDTVGRTGLFGFVSFGNGMAPGTGDVLLMKFAVAANAPSQVVTIDTTLLPPANHLVLNDLLANEIFPDFVAGTITVNASASSSSSLWITDAQGEAGDQVTVELQADNIQPVERLLLPLKLTSGSVSLVTAEFSGTRSASGVPVLTRVDDQHFTIAVDWTGAPLPAGTGSLARLVLQLDAHAAKQTVYVDTAGDYGFTLPGGSQTVNVPTFSRGTVEVDISSSVGDDPTLPLAFGLDSNYPNPFNPSTNIRYSIAAPDHVRLEVFNTLGRRVITLVEGYQSAGSYTVSWNGRDESGSPVPSGVYLYRLESGTISDLRKMTLLK